MARIAGVNIPTNKRVIVALQYIHGSGQAHAKAIVSKVGIDDARRVNQLTDAEVLQIREAIDRNARFVGMSIARDAQEAGIAMESTPLAESGCP